MAFRVLNVQVKVDLYMVCRRSQLQEWKTVVHIFGAKSSPSVAGYALRKTAKDNEQDFSAEVVDAIFKDFYVDGLLKSFAYAKHAVNLSG